MLSVGDILSQRYKITRFIGSGGTATVYLAKDLILERFVAVKVLRYDITNNDKALKRFHREAHAISELVHDGIVSLYDIGEDRQYQYLVMEYVDGTDLKQYIKQHYPLTITEVITIMKQIVSAVSVAHRHGIIHRDLKSQNVLIHKDGTIKITDFGIAIGLTDMSITQTNTLIGSIHYLSPEQARGGKATNQSDIYALGIIMYELLMGDVPFNGDTAVSIAMKHFQTPIPSIVGNTLQPIPQSIENIVLKATAKHVTNRYATCQEMLYDLQTCLQLDKQHVPKFIETKDSQQKINKKPIDNKTILDTTKKQSSSKKRHQFVGKLIGGLIAISAVLLSIWLLFFQTVPDVTIPDVSGKTQTEATELLSKAGLIIEKTENVADDTIKKGLVAGTNPKVATIVKKNSRIVLYISTGIAEEEVGQYKHKEYSAVYKELINKGFIVERQTELSTTVEPGYIISQSIEPGKKVIAKDTVIVLTVSSGAISFGDYKNRPFNDVKLELESQGFIVEFIEEVSSVTPIGYIISQNILENTKVDPSKTTVKFIISKGIIVPNFIGSSKDAALSHANTLGLKNIQFDTSYSSSAPKGSVIEQSISAGTSVAANNTITLTISSGEKETQTSNSSSETSTSKKRN